MSLSRNESSGETLVLSLGWILNSTAVDVLGNFFHQYALNILRTQLRLMTKAPRWKLDVLPATRSCWVTLPRLIVDGVVGWHKLFDLVAENYMGLNMAQEV